MNKFSLELSVVVGFLMLFIASCGDFSDSKMLSNEKVDFSLNKTGKHYIIIEVGKEYLKEKEEIRILCQSISLKKIRISVIDLKGLNNKTFALLNGFNDFKSGHVFLNLLKKGKPSINSQTSLVISQFNYRKVIKEGESKLSEYKKLFDHLGGK